MNILLSSFRTRYLESTKRYQSVQIKQIKMFVIQKENLKEDSYFAKDTFDKFYQIAP